MGRVFASARWSLSHSLTKWCKIDKQKLVSKIPHWKVHLLATFFFLMNTGPFTFKNISKDIFTFKNISKDMLFDTWMRWNCSIKLRFQGEEVFHVLIHSPSRWPMKQKILCRLNPLIPNQSRVGIGSIGPVYYYLLEIYLFPDPSCYFW